MARISIRVLDRAYSRQALLAGLAALAVLIWSVWMQFAFTVWPRPYWFEHRFARPVDSPLLALEFSRTPAEAATVFQQNDPNNPDPGRVSKARQSLSFRIVLACVRVPLTALYLFLWSCCYQPARRFGTLLLATLSLWTLISWTEYGILLSGHPPVPIAAAVMWLFAALTIVLTGTPLLRKKPGPYSTGTRRLLALAHVASGALVFSAICFDQLPWLEAGQKIFTATILLNLVGLLGPLFATKGVVQVSDPNFCEKRKKSAPPDSGAPASFTTDGA
ncbi:MAG TPA: hypothetical protein VKX25_06845 [Bryobacteraceae bacterium]|jgi:hypothetical protein|nr:hypothetical protein [Bryobacteraceae bacterium]